MRRRINFHRATLRRNVSLMRDVFSDLGNQSPSRRNRSRRNRKLVKSRTRVLYVESPTNPTVRLVDMKSRASLRRNTNSFRSSTTRSPLRSATTIKLGYDMVVHSATKALAGHSDVIAGVAVGNKKMDGARAAHGDLSGRLHGSGSGVFAESRNQDAGNCACKNNVKTQWPSRNFWRSMRKWRAFFILGSLRIRITNWPRSKCAGLAPCSRSI